MVKSSPTTDSVSTIQFNDRLERREAIAFKENYPKNKIQFIWVPTSRIDPGGLMIKFSIFQPSKPTWNGKHAVAGTLCNRVDSSFQSHKTEKLPILDIGRKKRRKSLDRGFFINYT